MADITKCKGINCPVKDNCYRYTARDSGLHQSWFVDDNVGKMVDNKFSCDVYWGKNAEAVWEELKEITKY
jgi:hypothetical protein